MVYRGWVDVPNTGTWTIGTLSDDGSKVYIDDELIVDNDGLHGSREVTSDRHLQAGMRKLRVEFFDSKYDATVQLKFGGPGFNYGVIPNQYLYHGRC